MRMPRFRIRPMMVVVAVAAIALSAASLVMMGFVLYAQSKLERSIGRFLTSESKPAIENSATVLTNVGIDRAGRGFQIVSLPDIGTKVVIVGRLGHPLGTDVVIVGTWVEGQGKGLDMLFSVDEVNGSKLGQPAVLEEDNFHHIGDGVNTMARIGAPNAVDYPGLGERWEVRGVELGAYKGLPNGVYAKAYTRFPPQISDDFGYYSVFWYYSARRLSGNR